MLNIIKIAQFQRNMTFIMSSQLLPYVILHIDILSRYIIILDSIVYFFFFLLDMDLFLILVDLLLPFAASPDIGGYVVL